MQHVTCSRTKGLSIYLQVLLERLVRCHGEEAGDVQDDELAGHAGNFGVLLGQNQKLLRVDPRDKDRNGGYVQDNKAPLEDDSDLHVGQRQAQKKEHDLHFMLRPATERHRNALAGQYMLHMTVPFRSVQNRMPARRACPWQ